MPAQDRFKHLETRIHPAIGVRLVDVFRESRGRTGPAVQASGVTRILLSNAAGVARQPDFELVSQVASNGYLVAGDVARLADGTVVRLSGSHHLRVDNSLYQSQTLQREITFPLVVNRELSGDQRLEYNLLEARLQPGLRYPFDLGEKPSGQEQTVLIFGTITEPGSKGAVIEVFNEESVWEPRFQTDENGGWLLWFPVGDPPFADTWQDDEAVVVVHIAIVRSDGKSTLLRSLKLKRDDLGRRPKLGMSRRADPPDDPAMLIEPNTLIPPSRFYQI